MTCTANLRFELQRDHEVYQKNVDIREQMSTLLDSENMQEKLLSKQKFCFDFFRAQQATNDVKDRELRFWQEQLLDIIKGNLMNA